MQRDRNYKKYFKIGLATFVFTGILFGVFFAMPVSAQIQSGYNNNPVTNPTTESGGFQIVPECGTTKAVQGPTQNGSGLGTSFDECGWYDLLELVRRIMAFMMWLSASIAVLSFAYAGFLYLTAFGEMGKVEQAHGIFSKVTIGFLFVFLGWLIVATILQTLGVKEAFSLVNFKPVDVIDIKYVK